MIIKGKGRLWLQLSSYFSMSECKLLAELYDRVCTQARVPNTDVY